MATLFDYIQWRGDLSFRQSPFNLVDSLILTRFSYLPFDDIVGSEPITLKDACQIFFDLGREKEPSIIMPQDPDLLRAMMSVKRYAKIKLQHYENILDIDNQHQFSALLIQLNSRTSYVAYRGTDLSLVGWKEDFNMTFAQEVPSQRSALTYLMAISQDLHAEVILGGHSKGGNLAIFAATFATSEVQEKIKAIHNFDGPGFNEYICQEPAFQKMAAKIQTFVPEHSFVGKLLNHHSSYKIVASQASGFLQHDTYTWLIQANDLVYADRETPNSRKALQTTSELLDMLSRSERQRVIDTIYEILSSTQVRDIREFKQHTPAKLAKMAKTYRSLDKETRQLVEKVLQFLIGEIIKSPLKKAEPENQPDNF